MSIKQEYRRWENTFLYIVIMENLTTHLGSMAGQYLKHAQYTHLGNMAGQHLKHVQCTHLGSMLGQYLKRARCSSMMANS